MFSRCSRFQGYIHNTKLSNRLLQQQLPARQFRSSKYLLAGAQPSGGNNGSPKRSAIRPITLFAICIPLGYALSVALQKQEDVADSDGFVKYTLSSKQDISSTSSIFTLTPATTTSAIRTDDPVLRRVITSVQFKQPQLQIARSYTLLPRPTDAQDPHELRFLIRKEANGEVSGYLHRLPLGAEVEVRGLSAEFILPEKVDTAIFLAGGTGITPAMQVARALAGEADVWILWANRRREDCLGGVDNVGEVEPVHSGWTNWSNWFGLLSAPTPKHKHDEAIYQRSNDIVEQLNELKQQSSETTPTSTLHKRTLHVNYYVDEEGTLIKPEQVSRLLAQAASTSKSTSESGAGGKNLLFVAGPDGFVNHWSAGKVWINGREVQGPLGGVLGTMDLRGWEVVKL